MQISIFKRVKIQEFFLHVFPPKYIKLHEYPPKLLFAGITFNICFCMFTCERYFSHFNCKRLTSWRDGVDTYANKRKNKGVHTKQGFFEDIHLNINFGSSFMQISIFRRERMQNTLFNNSLNFENFKFGSIISQLF